LAVSVLFSEPKIPQSSLALEVFAYLLGFSALQRAENSSIPHTNCEPCSVRNVSVLFSEPKIPQSVCGRRCPLVHARFSALQRAENSSMRCTACTISRYPPFQCSSASRKFLNLPTSTRDPYQPPCFSALQRAENSSIEGDAVGGFSALQRAENSSIWLEVASGSLWWSGVSVLFSEPKIPQLETPRLHLQPVRAFQCSSASRKFLNHRGRRDRYLLRRFQCSSASRKFLNETAAEQYRFVLKSFSALQRAENSSIFRQHRRRALQRVVSVLFSEPKIPQ